MQTVQTDRLGRTTAFEYDALNRLVKTTYSDGSTSQTEYDAAGRVTANVDARGNRTQYEYDAAGRRTAVVDALGNRMVYEYDATGNVIKPTFRTPIPNFRINVKIDQKAIRCCRFGTSAIEDVLSFCFQ